MAASGTYAFDPRIAEFIDESFERIGLDPAKLTVRHLRSARRSLDLMFAEWNNRNVKLWAVDQQTLDLVDGTATYSTLATGTFAILEAVIRRSGVDTPCVPMSRSEYAAISSKTTEGLPTRFYFARVATPTVTLWQVPENSTDDFIYWRMRSLQDVGVPSNTADIRDNWQEALASGLAAKLALKFAPARHDKLLLLAENSFLIAKGEERERGDTTFSIG